MSGVPATQKKIGQNIYNFISNFDKDFKLKEPVPEIFQIKYFRQALFYAKIYAKSTDIQQTSNMTDLSDFISENDIFAMKDQIYKLLEKR